MFVVYVLYISIYTMIGFRLLLAAVTLAAIAYVWNTSSHLPVVTSIEPAYDYIIGNMMVCNICFRRLFAVTSFLVLVASERNHF